MANRYVLDTSAWIEYFGSTVKGAKIKVLVENQLVATSIMAIAEWADKCTKEEWDVLPGLGFIQKRAEIIPVNLAISLKAAELKKKVRSQRSKFGLVDGIHLATTQQENAVLVTCDQDFKGIEGVMLI